MDKETMIEFINAKIDATFLSVLIDTILDNTELDYKGLYLEIRDHDNEIINLVKAFHPDEYKNRLAELKESEEG